MLVVWLTGINLAMYFALLSFPSRKDWLYFVSVAMWSFNLVISLTTCINLASLYISPHSALNNTLVQVKARDLLMCARSSVPNLFNEWTLLDKCLESAHVYNITAGRIPYDRSSLRHTPIAFVFMAAKDRSIFVTPEYQGLSLYLKALVLIHECAHIGLGAVDFAYTWQPEYLQLSEQQHYQNADSYMDAVFYHCI